LAPHDPDRPVKPTRKRRPWTWRRTAKIVLFLVGVAAGVEVSHLLSPDVRGFSFDIVLVRGLLVGSVFGAMLTQLASRSRSLTPRLPEDFGHSLERYMEELRDDEPQSE
jgi:hypothetical protein